MSKIIIIVIILICFLDVYFAYDIASSYVKIIGGPLDEYGASVIPYSDNSLLLIGATWSWGYWEGHPTKNILLVKYYNFNADSIEWAKVIGGNDKDIIMASTPTYDNGCVISGITFSYGPGVPDSYNIFICKLDSMGNVDWGKVIDIPTDSSVKYCYLSKIIQTNDSGYISVGETGYYNADPSDPLSRDLFILKFDSIGGLEWAKTVGGNSLDEGFSVMETPRNEYIVSGWTLSYGAGAYDLFIIKLNSDGELQWAKTVGEYHWEKGFYLTQAHDNGFIVTGYTRSFSTDNNKDMILCKFTFDGELEWAKVFSGIYDQFSFNIISTEDGGYATSGYILYPETSCRLFFTKFDSSCSLVWAKTIDDTAKGDGFSLTALPDNSYLLGGYEREFGSGDANLLIVKFDSSGYNCLGLDVTLVESDFYPETSTVSPIDRYVEPIIERIVLNTINVSPIESTICESDTIVSVFEKNIKFYKINIYPNPFNSACVITAPKGATVEIYDISGNVVYKISSILRSLSPRGEKNNYPHPSGEDTPKGTGEGQFIWQPDKTIPSGVYLVRATTEDGQTITKRIVYYR